jgi:bacterial/archaeal transporter family-2 protein
MKDQSYYMLILMGLMIGVSVATQSGVNATLRTALSSPVQSAFISFLVGMILLGTIAATQNEVWFGSVGLSKLPWWAWVGGALGAFNIVMTVYLAPRLGVLLLSVSIVTGQMLASLLLDYFGLVGFAKLDISATRLMGAVLMVAGLFLVANK